MLAPKNYVDLFTVKQFLIIQTAFLGDVILCTPLIEELNRIYPDASIDIVVRKGNEALLNHHPKLRHIFTFDKKKNKLSALWEIIRVIRKQRYHEVINLQRFTSSGIICAFSKTKQRIGFTTNSLSFIYNKRLPHDFTTGKHEVERNLLTLAHHGAAKKLRPSLYPSSSDLAKVSPYKEKPYFCLAPASVWFTKQLAESKWIELLQELEGKGTIFLLGGPSDKVLCERITRDSGVKTRLLAGELSLLESAALMKDAEMNYVNDSGPMHLCSAVNAPVRVFYCSTVPSFGFGPLSDNHKIIEIKEKLACRPCGLHGHKACPQGHFKCATEIAITKNQDLF